MARQHIYGSVRVGSGGVMCVGGGRSRVQTESWFSFLCECGRENEVSEVNWFPFFVNVFGILGWA